MIGLNPWLITSELVQFWKTIVEMTSIVSLPKENMSTVEAVLATTLVSNQL